jgi:hypothetical protein
MDRLGWVVVCGGMATAAYCLNSNAFSPPFHAFSETVGLANRFFSYLFLDFKVVFLFNMLAICLHP